MADSLLSILIPDQCPHPIVIKRKKKKSHMFKIHVIIIPTFILTDISFYLSLGHFLNSLEILALGSSAYSYRISVIVHGEFNINVDDSSKHLALQILSSFHIQYFILHSANFAHGL